ncbi:lactosylceramide 4-alpha-galactosyltransferase-like [Culicoides brevitarsis]|uniref:lactosylceramide 4-alpha-galactosyltransferase-like n=1 Tax=Culicoides brevitarsis TaxID=469753 RepID=UPI00307B6EB0
MLKLHTTIFVFLLANTPFFIFIVLRFTNEEPPKQQTLDLIPILDIDEGVVKPSVNNSDRQIFFIETTCAEVCDCGTVFDNRRICGFESTVRLHPDSQIFILIVNSDYFEPAYDFEPTKKLMEFKNIHFRSINLEKFSKGTPLEQFFATKRYTKSRFMKTHLSDILRYLVLWKYGGTYLDSDMICLKNLDDLGSNWASDEGDKSVQSAMMNLGNDDLGRTLAKNFLNEVNTRFNGKKWAINGPQLVTRVLQRFCKTKSIYKMMKQTCKGFKIYPGTKFAPVNWEKAEDYFKEISSNDTMSVINDAYTAHIFNHITFNLRVLKNASVPYAKLANQFCPDMVSYPKKKCI